MRNNFLISILFIILASVLYAYLTKPWAITAYKKYNHIKQLNQLLERADQIQQKRDELQAKRNRLPEEKERRIREAVPRNTPENKIQFFVDLDEMLLRSGLASDTSYSVGTERKEGDTNITIPISFTFGQMSYTVLRNFINNLQRWERGVRIQSVEIISENELESPELIGGAVVVIKAFFSDASENTS